MLLLLGLGLLAWFGWEVYGTTWVAKRAQAAAVESTERVWAEAPTGRADRGRATPDGVVALVRIPAFGDDYVVPVRRGTDEETLDEGFGLFAGSPSAGGVGNFALGGHRITHGEPLREMPALAPGDTVEVSTASTVYTYTLDTAGDALTVGMHDGWVTEPDPVDPSGHAAVTADSRRLLTLVTCAELFHTDDRLVAFGHLVAQRARH